MDIQSKIILIFGPTASGKSKFAIKLAKKLNGEIINADSMQVYKELKILTARPLLKEQKKIKHHLYGFQSVKKNFSTGQWLQLALKKIKEIKKKKKIPILVGGTGLYFKSLTDGLVKISKIPFKFRLQIRDLQKKIGQKKFYKKLLKIDPMVKGKINPNDIQRSIRAYEVKSFTKLSLYEWFNKTSKKFQDEEFIKIYLNYPREYIIEKINLRTKNMFKKGVINEVKKFTKLNVKKDKIINKVIGISEIQKYLNDGENLNKIIESISIKTRQYAKRQKTWGKKNMRDWLQIENHKSIKHFKF